jgi:hypothetical protein
MHTENPTPQVYNTKLRFVYDVLSVQYKKKFNKNLFVLSLINRTIKMPEVLSTVDLRTVK